MTLQLLTLQLQSSTLAFCLLFNATSCLLADESDADSSTATVALKTVLKEDFLVGTAVNRSITTGRGFRRSDAENQRDIELVKQQFNQVVAENDMKWQLIHPRPGADGYEFEPADALVQFTERNNMALAGHTLVWHSQTPNWVFKGTHLSPVASGRTGNAGDQATGQRGLGRSRGRPLLFDGANQPKPAFHAVIQFAMDR